MADVEKTENVAEHKQSEKSKNSDSKQELWDKRRFMLFYTLRFLWKMYKHPVVELDRMLFETKKGNGNRGVYVAILGLKDIDITYRQYEKLEKITGVPIDYLQGEKFIKISGQEDELITWSKFIKLRQEWQEKRKKENATKPRDLVKTQNIIDRWITEAAKPKNLKTKSETFQQLVYFAKNTKARKAETVRSSDMILSDVESAIAMCEYEVLNKASLEQLKNHYKVLYEYAKRVDAIITLKEWGGVKKM